MRVMTATAPLDSWKSLMFFDNRLTCRIMALTAKRLLLLCQEVRLIAGMGKMAQGAALGQGGMDMLTTERLGCVAGKTQILPRLDQQPLVLAIVGGMTGAALTLGNGLMDRCLAACPTLGLMTRQTEGRGLAP